MTENIYKVKPRVWKQWSEKAQQVFNSVYKFMMESQGLFLHPKAQRQPDLYWKTTCWNAAWTAADAVDEMDTQVEKVA